MRGHSTVLDGNASSPFDVGPLRGVALRLRLKLIVEAGLLSASYGLLVWALALVVAPWTEVQVDAMRLGLMAVVLTVCVRIAAFVLHPVTVLTAARYVDRRFGLQERASTSVESLRCPRTVVSEALWVDTSERLRQLPLRSSVSFWPKRLTIASVALGATCFALAVTLATDPQGGPSANGGVAFTTLSEGDVQLLSVLLEDIAAAGEDSYIEALAREASRMVENIRDDSNGEARQQHLEALDAMIRHLLALSDLDADARAVAEGVLNPSHDGDASETDEAASSIAPDGATQALESSAATSSVRDPGERLADGQSTTAPSSEVELVEDIHPESVPGSGPGDEASGPPGSFFVGAAENADAGASTVAGAGSTDLLGEAAEVDLLTLDVAFDPMQVNAELRDEGRRITIEIQPSLADERQSEVLASPGTWSSGDEAFVPVSRLRMAYRTAAATYFMPSQDTVTQPRLGDAP